MLFPAMSLSPPRTENEVSLDSPGVEEGAAAEGMTEKAAGKRREVPTLSEGLVRCIVSMAENPDDTFRAIALETLAELGECQLHMGGSALTATSASASPCGSTLPHRRGRLPRPPSSLARRTI